VLMILLSAQAHVETSYLREAGFAGYMTKPVRQSQLYNAIVDAIAAARAPQIDGPDDSTKATAFAPSHVGTNNARILLAEDNRINQIAASEILKKYGYTYEIVDNGKDAFEAAMTGAFDLVLMDCQMPLMDGFEATQEIRRWESNYCSDG
jgi:CheY-like chemotaxis protein